MCNRAIASLRQIAYYCVTDGWYWNWSIVCLCLQKILFWLTFLSMFMWLGLRTILLCKFKPLILLRKRAFSLFPKCWTDLCNEKHKICVKQMIWKMFILWTSLLISICCETYTTFPSLLCVCSSQFIPRKQVSDDTIGETHIHFCFSLLPTRLV